MLVDDIPIPLSRIDQKDTRSIHTFGKTFEPISEYTSFKTRSTYEKFSIFFITICLTILLLINVGLAFTIIPFWLNGNYVIVEHIALWISVASVSICLVLLFFIYQYHDQSYGKMVTLYAIISTFSLAALVIVLSMIYLFNDDGYTIQEPWKTICLVYLIIAMLYFTTNLTFLAISVFKFYSIVLINKQSLFKNEMPHDIRKNLYDQKIKEKNDRKHQIATRKLLPHHDKVTVIERYFEAYEKGLISYEEFKQKKQEVLKKRI